MSSSSSYMYEDYRGDQFLLSQIHHETDEIRERNFTSVVENSKLEELLQQREDECWELHELRQQKEDERMKRDLKKLKEAEDKMMRHVVTGYPDDIHGSQGIGEVRDTKDKENPQQELAYLRKLSADFEEKHDCSRRQLSNFKMNMTVNDVENIKRELSAAKKRHKKLEEDNRRLFSLMQNERQTLLNKIMLLEKQNKTLQVQATEDKENSQQELAYMRKLYEDLEEKQNCWRRQCSNREMNMKVNDAENIQRELITVRKRKKELEEEHRRFDQEREDTKLMHLLVLKQKEDEIRKMERNLQNKDTEVKSLESKLLDVQKAQKAIPETSEYQRLHREFDKMKKEKASLEIILQQNSKSLEEKEKKRKDLNVSVLQQLQNENEQLKDTLSKMKKDAEYPRYAVLDIKDKEQLQAELQNTRTENETYRQRISTQTQEIASAIARYERAESKIRNIQGEVFQKQSEIQTLKERIRQKETENNILQQDSERTLERKTDLEKELIKKNQNLQENLNQIRFELTKCQEENARSACKIHEKTDHELNMMKTEEQRLLKRNSQLESENSKLRESIKVISKEKDEALARICKVEAKLKISNMEVLQKMKQFQELQEHILQKEDDAKLLRKDLSGISNGKEGATADQQDMMSCERCCNPLEIFCNLCECSLCSICAVEHLKEESIYGHFLVNYRDKMTSSMTKFHCKKHTENGCKLFCRTCSLPFCKECVSFHEEHNISLLLEEIIKKGCNTIPQEKNHWKRGKAKWYSQ